MVKRVKGFGSARSQSAEPEKGRLAYVLHQVFLIPLLYFSFRNKISRRYFSPSRSRTPGIIFRILISNVGAAEPFIYQCARVAAQSRRVVELAVVSEEYTFDFHRRSSFSAWAVSNSFVVSRHAAIVQSG